ncbi:MAG: energy-coupling factor ABC transporter ATP-binding protein [Candidatus Poribacteria bacterium]
MDGSFVIRVENLSYRYPDGKDALINVSFKVKRGESVALMGPNGAGKTTLFLTLNGLLEANSGNVFIFDNKINGKKSIRNVRNRIGIVFQNPDDQLFCPTVFDDVAFGPLNYDLPTDEIKKRVKEALEAVDMSGFEHRLSHHLSFGEKKRVSIATILSMRPEIILLDEPSSNLDPRSRRKMIETIRNLDATKIIATHDLKMALELCGRGIIMDEGKIVADGVLTDIFNNRQLLEAHGLELP